MAGKCLRALQVQVLDLDKQASIWIGRYSGRWLEAVSQPRLLQLTSWLLFTPGWTSAQLAVVLSGTRMHYMHGQGKYMPDDGWQSDLEQTQTAPAGM